MEQYYRMVIELHKDALMGDLKRETIKEVQTKLATEITKVRITGGNDTELSQLVEDLNTLDFKMFA